MNRYSCIKIKGTSDNGNSITYLIYPLLSFCIAIVLSVNFFYHNISLKKWQAVGFVVHFWFLSTGLMRTTLLLVLWYVIESGVLLSMRLQC
jgi:hypothetical protein